MATTRVGIYRKYHGPIPKDRSGQPLAKSEWPRKRLCRWAVRWFGTDGKRYSKSFKTRKEAERYAEEKQQRVREGKGDPCPRISLRTFFKEHRQLMRGSVAEKTLHLHVATIRLLAESVGWDRKLDRISVRDIEKFRSDRLGSGISPSSANKEVKTLRRVFNLAILRGYMHPDGNPCHGIPMLRIAPKRPAFVPSEEFAAIHRAARDCLWQAFLGTVYASGIRLREAMHLTWHDVDFESGELHVTRKSSDAYVQAWTPKDHEMRSIPLPDQVVSLLAAWQSVAPEGCPYVFMDHGRWAYYQQRVDDGEWNEGRDLINNLLRQFKTICRRAGCGPYTLHDLRRSCITNWARSSPIHVVQQLAGHSDIKTTQQFYLSVQQDDIRKVRMMQRSLLPEIPPADLTDPKVTHSAQKRLFPAWFNRG